MGKQLVDFVEAAGDGEVGTAGSSGGVGLDSPPECFGGSLEPDESTATGRAGFANVSAIFFAQNCSATESENGVLAMEQVAQDSGFECPKGVLAVLGKNIGDRFSRARFDLGVGVEP